MNKLMNKSRTSHEQVKLWLSWGCDNIKIQECPVENDTCLVVSILNMILFHIGVSVDVLYPNSNVILLSNY